MDAAHTTTTSPSVPASVSADRSRLAGYAGAVSAGLALGLTELASGLNSQVPSAVGSVGSQVIDYSPPFVKNFAINVFGTADKGALAIGTVIVGVLLGAVIGKLALRRRVVGPIAFGLFALLGLVATFDQPSYEPIQTFLAIVVSAGAGAAVLDAMLRRIVAGDAETPTDGLADDGSRRRLLLGTVGVGAAAAVSGIVGRTLIIDRSETVRTSLALPDPVEVVPPPGPGTSFAVDGLTPLIVPANDFYRIDTATIVPRPDTESWRLRVTGLVDKPLEFSMSDLLAMPLHERYVTIACVSNDVGGNLIGNAKWTGVRLVELLEAAGVQPGADQVIGRSVDGWTAGFPTTAAFDGRDPLVAIGMNDEMLPPRHGYPARLIVPGLYGYVSATKWLEEIELSTWEGFDGYWIPRGWSKEGPIKTQSRIDTPTDGEGVDGGSPVVLAGVAWAPTIGIERVEVRIDEGAWEEAEISVPLADTTWVQWRFEKLLAPGTRYRAQVRATDGSGYTQTETEAPPAPDGATGYHTTQFVTS